MTPLLAILLCGAGTYLSRSIFILVLAHRRIPPGAMLALEHVGPAVLAALVVMLLTSPAGELQVELAEIVALAITALLAWRTRRHLLTLIAAMLAFWLVRFVVLQL